jgi:hypothetical protein
MPIPQSAIQNPQSIMPLGDNYNVPVPGESQTVVCLYCGQAQQIGRRAMSVTCKHCHKSLKLEDITYKQFESRRSIETCGMVTIEKKGNVTVTDKVNCGGMVIRGKLKGSIVSRGPVLVGPEAEIKGDVKAPTLAVGAGAILEGNYTIGDPEKSDEASPEP